MIIAENIPNQFIFISLKYFRRGAERRLFSMEDTVEVSGTLSACPLRSLELFISSTLSKQPRKKVDGVSNVLSSILAMKLEKKFPTPRKI